MRLVLIAPEFSKKWRAQCLVIHLALIVRAGLLSGQAMMGWSDKQTLVRTIRWWLKCFCGRFPDHNFKCTINPYSSKGKRCDNIEL